MDARRPRSEAQKVLETIASERCPCGHLKQRHRVAGEYTGPGTEVMGACRDCDCRGLVEFPYNEQAAEEHPDLMWPQRLETRTWP